MKCPLIREGVYTSGLTADTVQANCGLELCAWWDEDKNACSVKVIAKEMTNLQLRLKNE